MENRNSRSLEATLVLIGVAGLAVFIGVMVTTGIILPAFAKMTAAFAVLH